MPRLIDADALHRELVVEMVKCVRASEETKMTMAERVLNKLDEAQTIDPESLRPHGRCRYCSPEDGAGVEWDLEDIEVSMTLRCGKLTISNSFGDEADVPIRYCPICGAKMRLNGEEDDA